CIIISDHCFWIVDYTSPPDMHRSLLQWRGLLSALKAYRCYRQEAVMNAIIEATARDTDLEYAPLVHRMKLIVTGDKDEPGLTQDILSIALRHRLRAPRLE
ncbi:hypothetical protein FRB98_004760, partial [Tulasnella sp. 332]